MINLTIEPALISPRKSADFIVRLSSALDRLLSSWTCESRLLQKHFMPHWIPHQRHHCLTFFTNVNLLCCCRCSSVFYAQMPAQPQSNAYYRRVDCWFDPIVPECQINYLNHVCASNVTDIKLMTERAYEDLWMNLLTWTVTLESRAIRLKVNLIRFGRISIRFTIVVSLGIEAIYELWSALSNLFAKLLTQLFRWD